VTTAPQPRFLVKTTKSRDELLKGIDRLAPDTNTGRFTESLAEAAERATKDKDAFHVIIAAGTTSGDGRVAESDIQRAMENVGRKPMIVHVLLYAGERSATGGVTQIEVGEHVAKMTGGRYEFINAMTRYSSLLARTGRRSRQTADRQARDSSASPCSVRAARRAPGQGQRHQQLQSARRPLARDSRT
jgi:hypothetical protein